MVGLEVCLSCGAEPHMLNDGRSAFIAPRPWLPDDEHSLLSIP